MPSALAFFRLIALGSAQSMTDYKFISSDIRKSTSISDDSMDTVPHTKFTAHFERILEYTSTYNALV